MTLTGLPCVGLRRLAGPCGWVDQGFSSLRFNRALECIAVHFSRSGGQLPIKVTGSNGSASPSARPPEARVEGRRLFPLGVLLSAALFSFQRTRAFALILIFITVIVG